VCTIDYCVMEENQKLPLNSQQSKLWLGPSVSRPTRHPLLVSSFKALQVKSCNFSLAPTSNSLRRNLHSDDNSQQQQLVPADRCSTTPEFHLPSCCHLSQGRSPERSVQRGLEGGSVECRGPISSVKLLACWQLPSSEMCRKSAGARRQREEERLA